MNQTLVHTTTGCGERTRLVNKRIYPLHTVQTADCYNSQYFFSEGCYVCAVDSARPKPSREALEKSKQGIVSGVTASVANIGSLLSNVPVIGGVASTIGSVSGIISGIASKLGFDKPADLSKDTVINQKWLNYAHGRGVETARVLAFGQDAALTPLGPELGATAYDDSVHSIAQKPMLIDALDLDVDAKPSDPVYCFPVHPLYAPVGPNLATSGTCSGVYHTYSSFIANTHRYWRGSMHYTIKFLASQFHSARFRIFWMPRDPTIEGLKTWQDNGDIHNFPNMVVDVRGNTDVSFIVPYQSPRPYLRSSLNELVYTAIQMKRFFGTGGASSSSVSSTALATDFTNGCIVILQETPVVFPSSPIPKISMLLYGACGPDTQFAEPNTESFSYNNDLHNAVNLVAPVLEPVTSVNLNIGDFVDVSPPTSDFVQKALDEEIPVQVDQQETVGFQDQGPTIDAAVAPTTSKIPQAPSVPTIKDFLARPRLISNLKWTAADSAGTGERLDPLAEYLANDTVWGKLEGFQYMRCDVVVQLRVNGTRFHYGALGASVVPFGAPDDGIRQSLTKVTGYQSVVITPDQEDVVTLRLPYIYNKHGFDLSMIGWGSISDYGFQKYHGYASCGHLLVYKMTPLRGGALSSTVTDVNVAIYAHLENVELFGFTGTVFPKVTPPTLGNINIVLPAHTVGTTFPTCNFLRNTIYDIAFSFADLPPPPPSSDFVQKGWDTETVLQGATEIIPVDSVVSVPPGVVCGEVIDSIKTLCARSGYHGSAAYPESLLSGHFFSHFAQRSVRYPLLRRQRLGAHSLIKKNPPAFVTGDTTVIRDTSFMDVFRSIFLIERGSVVYRAIGADFAVTEATFERDTRLFGSFQKLAGNAFKNVSVANVNTFESGATDKFVQRLNTGLEKIQSVLQLPEVVIPYGAWQPFSYIPQILGDSYAAHVVFSPTLTEVPGFVANGTYSSNVNYQITKSAADDFQFAHLIPPCFTVYNPVPV